MKPYKFEPYLKTTIWGGYQIAPFKGIFNAQPNVGESWEISGVPAMRAWPSIADWSMMSMRD